MTENPPGDQGPLSKRPDNSGGFPPPPPPPPPGGGYPPPPGGGYPPPSGGGYPPPPPGGGYPPPPPSGNYPPPPGGGFPPPPPPGGYPPPSPGGGFGPPPGGGYPPPPGGGYPPPPPGNFGAGMGSGGFRIGDALTFGWNRYKENFGIWIGIAVLMYLVAFIINLPFNATSFSFSAGSTSLESQSAFDAIGGGLGIVGILVSTIAGYIIQAVFVRGALHEADRRKPAFGDFFQIPNIGQLLIAGLLVSVITFIGTLLCVIPGLIAAFLLMFTFYFVIDQGQDATTALKSSFELVKANVGPLILFVLAVIGINILGLCACGVGLLVSGPVTIIATGYAYRTLIGRQPALP